MPHSFIIDDSDSNITVVRFRGTAQHVKIMRREGKIRLLVVTSHPDSTPRTAYSIATDASQDRVECFSVVGAELLTYYLDNAGYLTRVDTIRRATLDSSFRENLLFWPEFDDKH